MSKHWRDCEGCGSKNVHAWTAYYWMAVMKKWLCLKCIYKKDRAHE